MPHEIEFKYILDFSQYKRDKWLQRAILQKWTVEEITQSYMGDSRIRKVHNIISKGKIVKKKRYNHIFTFKRKVLNSLFPIEINKNISKSCINGVLTF